MVDFEIPEPEDAIRRSPNVLSQETGEPVELPEGVNRFEYMTPGPHIPTRGWWPEEGDPELATTPLSDLGELKYRAAQAEKAEREESKTPTREGFRNQWVHDHGDPFERDIYAERDSWMKANMKGLFGHFFQGKKAWGSELNAHELKAWTEFIDDVSKDQLNKRKFDLQNQKEAYKFAMGSYDAMEKEKASRQAKIDKAKEAENRMTEWEAKEQIKNTEKRKYAKWLMNAKAEFEDANGKPKELTPNKKVDLDKYLVKVEEKLVDWGTDPAVKASIDFWNKYNLDSNKMWVWDEATQGFWSTPKGATPMKLPTHKDGRPVTVKEVLEEAHDKHLTPYQVLVRMGMFDRRKTQEDKALSGETGSL